MCTAKYPTDFLYLISRTDFVNQSLKLLTICFFNKVYILFLFVILKCHMVADTNPQYVTIVLSDHSWKQHNYPNGDLTFHWVLMDCFLSTFLIKKKKKKKRRREMLLSKLAVYILSGNGKIFRPESGYIPTVCSAPRVMTSRFSQGGPGNISDGKQDWDLKCKSCVALLLLWAAKSAYLWHATHPPHPPSSHVVWIEVGVLDKAWIWILVFLSLIFCKVWNLRYCFGVI